MSSDSNVIAIWNKNEKVELANEPQEYFIALNQTSIYAESGGRLVIEVCLNLKMPRVAF